MHTQPRPHRWHWVFWKSPLQGFAQSEEVAGTGSKPGVPLTFQGGRVLSQSVIVTVAVLKGRWPCQHLLGGGWKGHPVRLQRHRAQIVLCSWSGIQGPGRNCMIRNCQGLNS